MDTWYEIAEEAQQDFLEQLIHGYGGENKIRKIVNKSRKLKTEINIPSPNKRKGLYKFGRENKKTKMRKIVN